MRVKCNNCEIMCINGIPCHESGCHSETIYCNDKQETFGKWRYYENDIWGNEKEGYEVNDVSKTSIVITLPDEFEDKQLIRALKSNNVIGKYMRNKSFFIDGDETILHLECKGYPFGHLRRE